MKRFAAFILVFIAALSVASAQSSTVTIKGRVMLSDEKMPAIGAVVMLNASDSVKLTKIKGRVVATGTDGTFTIYTREKKADITVEYLGYKPVNVVVAQGKSSVNLGNIELVPEATDIERVVVSAKASMSKLVGDTVQFNASAFKTNPDATTEDLVKKMPGVTTDDNGNLESQGQSISKVYVNGKEYFDDPALALKSLPQDAVESVQLYDDKSDDAKFSGFDDGQRVRAINIVTKKGVMNSTFGKAFVGYGTDGRYSAGVGVNTFSDNHRLTVVAQINNVNNQGFTLSDISGESGGRGGRGRWGGGNNDLAGFTVPSYGGVTQGAMAGINYNGQFTEKFKLTASYFFNWRQADVWSIKQQQYITSPRDFNSADSSLGYQSSHRLRIRSEWNIDDNNRIVFNPSLNYSLNYGSKSNMSANIVDGLMDNSVSSVYGSNLERMSGSADLWWLHKFGKDGRTLNVGGVVSGQRDLGTRNQYSNVITYNPMLLDEDFSNQIIKQLGEITSSGYTFNGSATYTEPISTKSRLSANYSITYDKTITDKNGFNWDDYAQQYITQDTTATNYMNRNYTTHLAGLGYGFIDGSKFTLAANVNYQYATLNNKQITLRSADPALTSSAFQAVLPSLRMSYNPSKGNSLNVDYNTTSIFPSVNQLQTVLNMDNPLQVSTGNNDLKQSYSHRLNLRYNYSNSEKNLNLNVFATATTTSDYIATNRRFLSADTVINGTIISKGAQFSSPVNLQGYVSAAAFATFGFGIKPIQSNMNITAYYRYARTPSMQDDKQYISSSNRIGINLSLTSNISENIDFTVSYRPGLNLSQGSSGGFDRYFSHNVSALANIIFLKYFFVNIDVSWRNTFGTQATYEQHYALLNGALGAKFLKNRSAEIRLSVYDALGENRSIWQSTTDSYIQTTQSKVLQQYFMLAFTYKFDTRKSASRR